MFFYQSKQLTDYIYTDIWAYCKLSKCIEWTLRSYEHYLVHDKIPFSRSIFALKFHFAARPSICLSY